MAHVVLAVAVAVWAGVAPSVPSSVTLSSTGHNITFSEPVPLGNVRWGVTDTIDFDSNGSFAVVVGEPRRTLATSDGGRSFVVASSANNTVPLGTNVIRVPGGLHPLAHDFGNVSHALHSPGANYWESTGDGTVRTWWQDTPVVFELPMHLGCDAKYSTCPLRLQGSGVVRFGDGTMLQSAIVYTKSAPLVEVD